MTAFLRQIRRGEIDRNVGPRKAQTDSMERSPHTLTTFRDGLVRQTDDGKDVLSGADPDFHLNRARLGQAIPEQILTAREEEVLKLVAEGHSSKEIAGTLFISIKTVERHRANMLQKLGLRDRLVTRYAIRAGLIEP